MLQRRKVLLGAAALPLSSVVGKALASASEPWPSRPITMVVPFPPGGATDIVARLLARQLSEQIGQSIVVDNRAGANSTIGMQSVAKSKADGYTILYNTASIALAPSLMRNLPLEPLRDFEAVRATATIPLVLLVHPSVPANNVGDFVRHARGRKSKPVLYASSSAGSVTHLATVMFARSLGFEATHVPYRGTAPAMIDLVGGQVEFMINTLNDSLPFIRDGRVRALAIAGRRRSALLPDVPTVAETVIPDFDVSAWQGVVVPTGTPGPVVSRLATEIGNALRAPAVEQRLLELGAQTLAQSGKEYSAYIRQERDRWRALIDEIGLKPEE